MKIFNILVIEDDEVDQMSLRRSFEKSNITNPLYFANDGIEGYDFLKKHNIKPLIVLLDINMPRMNGIELLKKIREDNDLRDLIIIVLTTSTHEKDKIESYKLNVAGYILKPVSPSDFLNITTTIGKYWTLCEFP